MNIWELKKHKGTFFGMIRDFWLVFSGFELFCCISNKLKNGLVHLRMRNRFVLKKIILKFARSFLEFDSCLIRQLRFWTWKRSSWHILRTKVCFLTVKPSIACFIHIFHSWSSMQLQSNVSVHKWWSKFLLEVMNFIDTFSFTQS